MVVEQITARLLAEIRTYREKTDAHLRDMREEMAARLEAKIEAHNEKFEAHQARTKCTQKEVLDKMEAHHERMMVRMDSQLDKMEACLGRTETTDLEINTEELES
jgi:hypothetical protein